MNLNDITAIDKRTLDVIKSVGKLYLDEDTRELTLVGENIIQLEEIEYKRLYSYYKKYEHYLTQGGSCIPCNEQRKKFMRQKFDTFIIELKRKYFGE